MKKNLISKIILVILLAILVYFLENRRDETANQLASLKLEPRISEANGINFEAAPLDFNLRNPVKFNIKIDTHSGSLDFDLIKISSLEDDLGNKYQPLEWQGPAPGGHHLSGTLLFPKLTAAPKELKLIIQDKTPRIFNWDLK